LRAKQAESGKTKASSSNVVVVPVQQEKSTSKTTPLQKNSTLTSKTEQSSGTATEDELSSRLEKQEKLFETEKSNLEELHQSKVKALEEQVTRCKDQLKSQQKDSDAAAVESKKALADVKSRYERELATWTKERDAIKKSETQVDTNFVILGWHIMLIFCVLAKRSSVALICVIREEGGDQVASWFLGLTEL